MLGPLLRRVEEAGIRVMTGTEVEELVPGGVTVGGGRRITGDATVICSGFELFDARLKEEYGYGIYDNVFTTVDIERMLNEGRVATAQARRRAVSPFCTAWVRATRRSASSTARAFAASRA